MVAAKSKNAVAKRRGRSASPKKVSPKRNKAASPKIKASKKVPGKPKAAKGKGAKPKAAKAKPKGKPVKRKIVLENEDEVESDIDEPQTASLFTLVKKKAATTVDDWLEQYQEDESSALIDLINFVIEAGGCPGRVDLDDFESGEMEKVFERLTADPQYKKKAETDNYPIASKTVQLKKFKSNFCDFWNKLILKSSKTILHDDFFIDNLHQWISCIAGLNIRSLRHTATCAGLEIISGLAKCASDQKKLQEKVERQHKASKKSSSPKKISNLESQIKKFKKSCNTLDEIQGDFFTTIFCTRYPDVFPEIRILCLSSLGKWINQYPSFWLKDEKTRYFGWLLSDKAGEVRESTLKTLAKLLENDNYRTSFLTFAQRFKDRILTMARDKEQKVAIRALSLCIHFKEMDILEDEDTIGLIEYLGDNDGHIRECTANFLLKAIFEDFTQEASSQKDLKHKRFDELKAAIEFIGDDSPTPDNALYFVDHFFNKYEALRDWKNMIELALTEDKNIALTENEETLLGQIMLGTVKKIFDLQLVPKSKGEPQCTLDKAKTAEKTKMKNDCTKIFMRKLPELLTRFGSQPLVIQNLIEIPQYLPLEKYTEFNLLSNLTDFLNILNETVEKNIDIDVLKSCSSTYFQLLAVPETKPKAEESFRELFDSLLNTFNEQNGELSQEQESPLYFTLLRISELYLKHNISEMDVFDSTLDILTNISSSSSNEISEDLAAPCVSILYQELLWKFSEIDVNSPEVDLMQELSQKRDKVFTIYSELIDCSNITLFETLDQIFFRVLDLFTVFSVRMKGTSLGKLAFNIPFGLLEKVVTYFETNLNTEQEKTEEEETRNEDLISAIARPIAFGSLGSDTATTVLIHFQDQGKLATQYIKGLLNHLRKLDANAEWLYISATLKKSWEAVQNGDYEMSKFKDLATKLAKSYGVQITLALRRTISKVVMDGIRYSLEEKESNERFEYLSEGLTQFVSKLTAPDCKRVLAYWNQQIETLLFEPALDSDGDLPYHTFADYLTRASEGQKGKKKATPKGTNSKKPVGKKRKTPEKPEKVAKKLLFTEGEENQEEEEEQEQEKSPKRRKIVSENNSENSEEEDAEESQEEQLKRQLKKRSSMFDETDDLSEQLSDDIEGSPPKKQKKN